MGTILEKSKEFGIKCHRDANCQYDGKPYEIHLEMVYNIGLKFIHLIPKEKQENVLSACWIHDTIEDCRQTYNDVKNSLNEDVAELAYALTNEKGKTRKERASDKYYEGIRNTQFASYVKLCDRIANYQYSIKTNSKMSGIYEKEMDDFLNKVVNNSEYIEMVDYLKSLKNK